MIHHQALLYLLSDLSLHGDLLHLFLFSCPIYFYSSYSSYFIYTGLGSGPIKGPAIRRPVGFLKGPIGPFPCEGFKPPHGLFLSILLFIFFILHQVLLEYAALQQGLRQYLVSYWPPSVFWACPTFTTRSARTIPLYFFISCSYHLLPPLLSNVPPPFLYSYFLSSIRFHHQAPSYRYLIWVR